MTQTAVDTVGGPETTPAHPPAIEARHISKQFSGTLALYNISLGVVAGTVHALVGENGAGKSTFLGILAGRLEPTEGEAYVFGARLNFGHPRHARQAGIVAIYQELTIVPALSTQANVFLGQTRTRGGFLAEREMRSRFGELCRQFEVSIPPDIPAGRLSVAGQQMLEIMRGVQSRARVILLDEPTTALAPPERESLFRVVRQLREQGVTMVYVSHNLEEVLGIADHVTVLRDGELAASAPNAEWTKSSLVRAMIGHDLSEGPARALRVGPTASAPVLRAEGVSVPNAIEDVAISVRAGEIVGLGGLVGAGRTTLLRALAGLEPKASGRLWIDGREVPWPRKPQVALAHGIALIPEDRKTQGLVLGMSAMDNVAMSDFGAVAARGSGFLSRRRMLERSREVAREFDFDEARVATTTRNLSGGNQQKLLLMKWRHKRPRILLLDEPTRGIDVGAKEEILATLGRLATNGLALVVVSSELEEVVAVSDRVLVLSEGLLVAELAGKEKALSVSDILHAAFKVAEVEREHG